MQVKLWYSGYVLEVDMQISFVFKKISLVYRIARLIPLSH